MDRREPGAPDYAGELRKSVEGLRATESNNRRLLQVLCTDLSDAYEGMLYVDTTATNGQIEFRVAEEPAGVRVWLEDGDAGYSLLNGSEKQIFPTINALWMALSPILSKKIHAAQKVQRLLQMARGISPKK